MFGSLAITSGEIDAFDFRLSSGVLSANSIFDAATSTPGRYVLEIARRTIEAAPGCDTLVISNPVLPLSGQQIADLTLRGGELPCPCVISDQGKFPVAYVLPRSLFDLGLGKFLCLLSTFRDNADAMLLTFLTGKKAARKKSPLKEIGTLPLGSPQGYVFRDNPDAWLTQCVNAVALMRKRPNDWPTLPFAAHHPNHAGDVMFFSLASRIIKPEHLIYQKQIVCAPYLDIFHDCGSTLEPEVLDYPPVSRDGQVSDGRYFIDSLAHIDQKFKDENFIVHARFSKSYSVTPFNLIDHARFTLGDPIPTFADTLYGRAPVVTNRCPHPTSPLRVLLQLNGGWPLKTLRKEDRSILVRALRALSIEVTVLDLEDMEADGATVTKAGNTARLTELVNDHHVFVSVDSFPLHYASQIMGHPCVGLFGPTAPSNSDAPRGYGYRVPAPLMPCSPCGGYQICFLTYGLICSNYPQPNEIVAAVLEVADEVYNTSFAR